MNTTDKSDIERLVKILRKCRYGSDISHDAANLIEALTEENFELRVQLIKSHDKTAKLKLILNSTY